VRFKDCLLRLLLTLVSLLLLSCGPTAEEKIAQNGTLNVERFPTDWDAPWYTRVYPIKDGLGIGEYGYKYSPEDEAFLIKGMEELIPIEFHPFMQKHFLGVFPIFGTSTNRLGGFAFPRFDTQGKPYFGMTVVMNPFSPALAHVKYEYPDMEEGWSYDNENSTEEWLQELLLHEMAHGLDYVFEITEDRPWIVNRHLPEGRSWSGAIWKDPYNPKEEFTLPRNINLRSYQPFYISDFLEMELLIIDSPYITYYGSTNAAEDFAEAFSTYVLTQKLGKNPKTTITTQEGVIYTLEHWKGPKQQARLEGIREIYEWIIAQDFAPN
jgi:hypothetical protein